MSKRKKTEVELECTKPCEHAHQTKPECHHPDFEGRRFKPLIIAEEGSTHPVFCPLVKKDADASMRRSIRYRKAVDSGKLHPEIEADFVQMSDEEQISWLKENVGESP